MRGTWLCAACALTVPPLGDRCCPRCGFPSGDHCRACRDLDPRIIRARAAYPFMGWVSESVRLLKYASETDRARSIVELMAPAAADCGDVDVVVPVPLHDRKLDERGYNQSAVLAEGIARSLGIPSCDWLSRTRHTASQVSLDRTDRLENVLGAFAVQPSWIPEPGIRVLLVDDVRTTGATFNACVYALAAIQPRSVTCLTFALDVPKRELQAWLSGGLPPSR